MKTNPAIKPEPSAGKLKAKLEIPAEFFRVDYNGSTHPGAAGLSGLCFAAYFSNEGPTKPAGGSAIPVAPPSPPPRPKLAPTVIPPSTIIA